MSWLSKFKEFQAKYSRVYLSEGLISMFLIVCVESMHMQQQQHQINVEFAELILVFSRSEGDEMQFKIFPLKFFILFSTFSTLFPILCFLNKNVQMFVIIYWHYVTIDIDRKYYIQSMLWTANTHQPLKHIHSYCVCLFCILDALFDSIIPLENNNFYSLCVDFSNDNDISM